MDYHDVLAVVGAGSAHPGGFDSTNEWLGRISLDQGSKVLDVGCGTGRTLLEIQRRYGCDITGVDIRKAMIRKAKQRSQAMGVAGSWKVAAAEDLPFKDNTFDLVYTESVNVFVDARKALGEYVRVLKGSGAFVDVEMMITGPVTQSFRESARTVYGARQVPDLRGWKNLYREAGFVDVEVLKTFPVRPEHRMWSDQAYPDPVDLSDAGAYQDDRVMQVLRANSNWLEQNHRWLGYGIFLCRTAH